jgi:putative hydrolase of the HAD superfamily
LRFSIIQACMPRIWGIALLKKHRILPNLMFNEPRWGLVRAVLIDAVGTLIEPVPSVAEVYAQAARHQQVGLSVQVVRDRFRSAFATDEFDDQQGPMLTDEPTEFRRWQRIVRTCLPEVPDLDLAFRELWHHFARPSSWRPFPDAGPALSKLAEIGIPVRVASNFDARLRQVLAGLPDLAPWSDQVVISSEVGVRKPHPAFYQRACESLGLPPESVLAVGDDEQNDLIGPRNAGLQSVLLDRSGRARPEFPTLRGLVVLAENIKN